MGNPFIDYSTFRDYMKELSIIKDNYETQLTDQKRYHKLYRIAKQKAEEYREKLINKIPREY